MYVVIVRDTQQLTMGKTRSSQLLETEIQIEIKQTDVTCPGKWENIMSDNRMGWEAEEVANVKTKQTKKKSLQQHKRHWQNYFL